MSAPIRELEEQLKSAPKVWVITGVAGFIGSHLLQKLLELNQTVRGIDNYSNGFEANLEAVRKIVGPESWRRFTFCKCDIRSLDEIKSSFKGADVVLHQAALGSVPRSIEDPLSTHQSNVDGTLNVLIAARDEGAKRVVYASSSSVYGDNKSFPIREEVLGKPLSPYALSKQICEQYADIFKSIYGLSSVGLRYFNVFGPRQNPNGQYAAVIPRWIHAVNRGEDCQIYGDGTISRDFCFVSNVVQANLLAACNSVAAGAFNIACGQTTSLIQLYEHICSATTATNTNLRKRPPVFCPPRKGDIFKSLANIDKAREILGYSPSVDVNTGISMTVASHSQLNIPS